MAARLKPCPTRSRLPLQQIGKCPRLSFMPWGLTRFHHSGQSHFVTFCCYHRRRLFATDASRRIFESALERVRRSFTYGYSWFYCFLCLT